MNSLQIAELEAHNEQLIRSLNHLMSQNISAENLLNELLERANPRSFAGDTLVAKISTLHMHWHRQLCDKPKVLGVDMSSGPDQSVFATFNLKQRLIVMKGRKHGLSDSQLFTETFPALSAKLEVKNALSRIAKNGVNP